MSNLRLSWLSEDPDVIKAKMFLLFSIGKSMRSDPRTSSFFKMIRFGTFDSAYHIQPIELVNDSVGHNYKSVYNSNYHTQYDNAFVVNTGGIYSKTEVPQQAFALNNDALSEILSQEFSSRIPAFNDSIYHALYGNGLSRAKVASITGLNVVLSDVTRVFVDMAIVASPNITPLVSNIRASTGAVRITKIDYDTRTITLSGAITGLAANDYIYSEGDVDTTYKPNETFYGLGAILSTDIANLNVQFRNIDRSVNPRYYNGFTFDASGKSLTDILDKAIISMTQANSGFKVIVCHINVYQKLHDEFFKKYNSTFIVNQRVMVASGIELDGYYLPGLRYPIITDNFCPNDKIYLLDPDSFEILIKKNLFDSNSVLLNKSYFKDEYTSDIIKRLHGYFLHINYDFPDRIYKIIIGIEMALNCKMPYNNGVIYNVDKAILPYSVGLTPGSAAGGTGTGAVTPPVVGLPVADQPDIDGTDAGVTIVNLNDNE